MNPGSWTDHGLVINSTTSDDFNAIDPNLAVNEDNDLVLQFGSFWVCLDTAAYLFIFQMLIKDMLNRMTSSK
jgi:beta-xylosidase